MYWHKLFSSCSPVILSGKILMCSSFWVTVSCILFFLYLNYQCILISERVYFVILSFHHVVFQTLTVAVKMWSSLLLSLLFSRTNLLYLFQKYVNHFGTIMDLSSSVGNSRTFPFPRCIPDSSCLLEAVKQHRRFSAVVWKKKAFVSIKNSINIIRYINWVFHY